MTRIIMDPGAFEKIYGSTDAFFEQRLGPDIAADAFRYCPKKTGALSESINDYLDGHDLIVEATGSAQRWYAAWVELGHEIAHGPRMKIIGPQRKGPMPFLRPAVYQERSY